jgi:ATP-dependent 26S proteasome regulatory subunit
MAILRSGRVELWLETRLPDISARTEIFREHLAAMPPPLCNADVAQLASASHGATGADLKAIIEDGKLLFARDQTTRKHGQPAEGYFLDAIATIRRNRRKYKKRRPAQLIEGHPIGFIAE